MKQPQKLLLPASTTCVVCVRSVVGSARKLHSRCNSVLVELQGLHWSHFNEFRMLLPALDRFNRVTSSLVQLHWPLIIYWVKFKLCCIIHTIYHGRSPTYLSSEAVFGERAFSHTGPATWNTLPDYIHTMADPVKFWKLLKSYYFGIAFRVCWTVWTVRLFFISVFFVIGVQ